MASDRVAAAWPPLVSVASTTGPAGVRDFGQVAVTQAAAV